jgi:hypothetical protein
MFSAENLPGMIIGLLIIAGGTFLGVRATLRRRDHDEHA